MNRQPAEDILLKYKNGEATANEKKLVEDWIINGVDADFDLTDEELLEDLMLIRARLNLNTVQKPKIVLWQRIAVAASIVLVTAVSITLYVSKKQDNLAKNHIQTKIRDKVAIGNIATLTLSDGSLMKLDSSVDEIKKENGIEIANDGNGNLTYQVAKENSNPNSNRFNTVTTPRGGTYKVTLPDGSKVWLNASSSLYFPVAFSGDVRSVTLTGEGYFEVAKANKKFIVTVNNTTVEVLGTHFNINSYTNEQTRNITLVEGSVKVANGNSTAILKPSDQAVVNPLSNNINIKHNVDTETLTAWKDGTFKFNNTDLKTIMRQLERWYDIDIDENTIPNKQFNGTISRDVKLSEVLAMIELTSNLNFKIEGRNLKMK
ncbi:FecR family protein [Pedobacter arcticus]|uniref:FecR family protein n=1 Tax=Pedobacter arcticus TaxID=752140 RepID=UPI000379910F|nr:FecR family protein [Pedobacter arcticus]